MGTASVDDGDRPYTGDIEIRVHGVSGTPPEELLGRADVHQVAGDRLSGFYRPSQPGRMRDEPAPGEASAAAGRGPWLEGYSWGGWTSGARSRVLWLVLLPLALVNVASRMLLPEPADRPGPARRLRLATAGLLRILALSMTVTMVQGVIGVSMVTVALRCGTVPGKPGACHGLPSWLTDVLGRLPLDARVLLCAAAPLAVMVVLWAISRRASTRYENAPARSPHGRPDDAAQPLLRADLWRTGPAAARLRLVHMQVAVVSVAGTAAWLLPGGASRTATLWLCAAELSVGSALAALRPRPPCTAERRRRIMVPPRLLWLGLAAVVAALAWQVVPNVTGSGPVTWNSQSPEAVRAVADLAVVRADTLVQYLFVGQAGLLVVIALLMVAARLAGAGRGRMLFMGGFAAFFTAMLAWLLGSMLTSAVLILGPAWLVRPGFAITPQQIATVLADPVTAGWFGNTSRSAGAGTSAGIGVAVLLVILFGVCFAVARRTGGSRRDRESFRRGYPSHASSSRPTDQRRAQKIGAIFWAARRVDTAPWALVAWCAVMAMMLIVQGLALVVSSGRVDGWTAAALGRTPVACQVTTDTELCAQVGVVAWGVYLTAGLGVVILLVGVLAYRTRTVRRGVGVFWDLACFWPRDTHPFAPPCYNDRIMPQVSARVAWYLGTDARVGAADPSSATGPGLAPPADRRGRVVLAGHSQGSVIALAAALIQPPSVQRRLALVTAGCVLDRLYSRFFPRYFGPEIYRLAAAMLSADTATVNPTGDPTAQLSGGPPGAPSDSDTRPPADGPEARHVGGLASTAEPSPNLAGGWVNIWRHSDFLGGAVPHPERGEHSGPRNVQSIDPVFAVPAGDTVEPPARRHSDFWSDPAFLEQLPSLLTGSVRDDPRD